MSGYPGPSDLRHGLIEAAMDEGWTADAADAIADVATRRWNSFVRRHPKRFGLEDRVLDLARGLPERPG